MADTSPASTSSAGTAFVPEYEIPFADKLPGGKFDPEWLDWKSVSASCVVLPDPNKLSDYGRIESVVGWDYVDVKGQPDPKAGSLLLPPQKVSVAPISVQFEVETHHTQSARDAARTALRERNGEFLLRARLKARPLMPGLQNLAGSAAGGPLAAALGRSNKPMPAAGKVRLRLEMPRSVIWSEEPDGEEGKKRITVDPTGEQETVFRVSLYEYDKTSGKYQPATEVLDAVFTGDNASQYEVCTEAGKLKVKRAKGKTDEDADDDAVSGDSPVGEISVTRKAGAAGPQPINEPWKIPVYLDPPCRINWKWWPVNAGPDGKDVVGPAEQNTQIRVIVDDTERHGFLLEVQCQKRSKAGYKPRDADFTHYLAPGDPRLTPDVVSPIPLPWLIPSGDNQRQITTTWRTKILKDKSLLGQLPISTFIRVRAWPAKSIVHHNPDARPDTKPEDAVSMAMRKVPLILLPPAASSSGSSSASPSPSPSSSTSPSPSSSPSPSTSPKPSGSPEPSGSPAASSAGPSSSGASSTSSSSSARPIEFTLAIKLIMAGAGEPFTVIRDAKGDKVTVTWSDLAPGTAGHVQWKVLRPNSELQSGNYELNASNRYLSLSTVQNESGQPAAGVEITVGRTAATKGYLELPNSRDQSGAEMERGETVGWNVRPSHWPAEMREQLAFRTLGQAVKTELVFESKFCDLERAQYCFDRLRKAAAVYGLHTNMTGATLQARHRPEHLIEVAGGALGATGAAALALAGVKLLGVSALTTNPAGWAVLILTALGAWGGSKLGEQAGEAFDQKFGDPENCNSLKVGPGASGNCGEWSYAFQSMLTGAGMGHGQVVYAAYDPQPGRAPANSVFVEVKGKVYCTGGFVGTDTAMVLKDYYLGPSRSVEAQRIFDIFRQLYHFSNDDAGIASTRANLPPTASQVVHDFGPQNFWLGDLLAEQKPYIKDVDHIVLFTVPGASPPPPSP